MRVTNPSIGGRPRKAAADRSSERLVVMLTPAQMANVKQRAKDRGLDVRTMVRHWVDRGCP